MIDTRFGLIRPSQSNSPRLQANWWLVDSSTNVVSPNWPNHLSDESHLAARTRSTSRSQAGAPQRCRRRRCHRRLKARCAPPAEPPGFCRWALRIGAAAAAAVTTYWPAARRRAPPARSPGCCRRTPRSGAAAAAASAAARRHTGRTLYAQGLRAAAERDPTASFDGCRPASYMQGTAPGAGLLSRAARRFQTSLACPRP